jgi:hypothetical protein
MIAQLELNKNSRIFSNVNITLRITYGKVKGYEPKDATFYTPVTYLDSVMEKYIPADYEFDVPTKLKDPYKTKDYGPYGENGKMSVCFFGTNQTTGANSGSLAIDANENLTGLILTGFREEQSVISIIIQVFLESLWLTYGISCLLWTNMRVQKT